jgi:hypothetical protein
VYKTIFDSIRIPAHTRNNKYNMCQGINTPQDEATPRNGDSAKKRRLTLKEQLALAARAQEDVCPDSPYQVDSDDDFNLQALDQSLPAQTDEPVSPVRRRSSGSVGGMALTEPHDRAACLRDEQNDVVQAAYGFRPEFRAAKRTQAQRVLTGMPRAGPSHTPDKYALESTIGQGASAKVWSAVEAETGDKVAVKVVQDSDFVSHETAAMAAVRGSDHALSFVECFMHEGEEHIVTELANGDLLEQLQDRGPVPESQARVHAKAMLTALGDLHRAGYSHRDVKLENLLVSHSGRVLLGDFGSAAPLKNADGTPVRHWLSVGSSSYMAPEVMAANTCAGDYGGVGADVWSSGVVLYAMVAGEFPFEYASPDCSRYQKFLQGEHTWPMHFSSELVEMISSMMLADPQQRSSVESALSHPWVTEEEACI